MKFHRWPGMVVPLNCPIDFSFCTDDALSSDNFRYLDKQNPIDQPTTENRQRRAVILTRQPKAM